MYVQKFPLSLLYNIDIVGSDAPSYWAKLHYGYHEIRQIILEFVKLVEGKNPLININYLLKCNNIFSW